MEEGGFLLLKHAMLSHYVRHYKDMHLLYWPGSSIQSVSTLYQIFTGNDFTVSHHCHQVFVRHGPQSVHHRDVPESVGDGQGSVPILTSDTVTGSYSDEAHRKHKGLSVICQARMCVCQCVCALTTVRSLAEAPCWSSRLMMWVWPCWAAWCRGLYPFYRHKTQSPGETTVTQDRACACVCLL